MDTFTWQSLKEQSGDSYQIRRGGTVRKLPEGAVTFSQGLRPIHVDQTSLSLLLPSDLPVPLTRTNRMLEGGASGGATMWSASQSTEPSGEHREAGGGLGISKFC